MTLAEWQRRLTDTMFQWARPVSSNGHPQSKAVILLVDDERELIQMVAYRLLANGYEVLAAASGPDALEQLKSQRVHLILLDLMMPVMDGYEVYHLLKENPDTKEVPVIIVTAKGERKDRQLGMDGTPYNYVSKPFQLEDLLAKVRDVLQQQSSMKAQAADAENPGG